MKKTVFAGLVAGFSLLGMSNGVYAARDYDFNGTFTEDNDVVCFEFTVNSASTVTLFTSSWDDGGFDPVLTLWDSAGKFILDKDNSGIVPDAIGNAVSDSVSYTYGFTDVLKTQFLEAGTYFATLTQWDNYSEAHPYSNAAVNNTLALADGFIYDDLPNFTYALGIGPLPYFNGSMSTWTEEEPYNFADPRNGNWAFHIVNVSSAQLKDLTPVPVPPSAFLLATSLVGLVGVRIRRKK